jgi:hypothetical protein
MSLHGNYRLLILGGIINYRRPLRTLPLGYIL